MSKVKELKTTKKNIHEGHRVRLRQSVDKDSEMESFSDFETLEYVLSFLIPRKDTNAIAHDLIESFDSLYGVMTATSEELYRINGMTETAAHFLPNMMSVMRRAELSRRKRSVTIEKVKDAVEMLRPYFTGRNHEIVYMMTLDVNDRLMSITRISQGCANFTQIDLNMITAIASRTQAVKIILAHNHPGGNLIPSKDDEDATAAVILLLNTMGKELNDHIIFANDGYFSFYENDKLSRVLQNTDKLFGNDRNKEVSARLYVNKYVLEDGEEKEWGTAMYGSKKPFIASAEDKGGTINFDDCAWKCNPISDKK